jgi:hypothetical protein
LWERFPENECFASVGTFVPIPESSGIPHGAVIGVDGKLLWAGNPASEKQTIEEFVDEQLKLMKKGWGDSSDARKVRAALYGKNNIASATAVVAAMADGDEKAALQQEIDKRYAVQKAAIDNLKKQGCWLAAEDAAKELLKSVGKHETWAAEVTELAAGFATDDAKVEIDADKKLDKIVKTMKKGKLDRAPKALQKLVEDAGQTGAGQRAERKLAALQSAAGD